MRKHLVIGGIVQGVGFRPFVYTGDAAWSDRMGKQRD